MPASSAPPLQAARQLVEICRACDVLKQACSLRSITALTPAIASGATLAASRADDGLKADSELQQQLTHAQFLKAYLEGISHRPQDPTADASPRTPPISVTSPPQVPRQRGMEPPPALPIDESLNMSEYCKQLEQYLAALPADMRPPLSDQSQRAISGAATSRRLFTPAAQSATDGVAGAGNPPARGAARSAPKTWSPPRGVRPLATRDAGLRGDAAGWMGLRDL